MQTIRPSGNFRIHSQIWALAWPMMLANVATTFIGLVDTAILGHMDKAAYIGGAAVATSLFNIIYMSLAFLRMGTTGLIAQHFGEKQWQDLYATLSLSILLSVFIGLLLIIFSSPIFYFSIPLIGGSAAVQDVAHEYAAIRVLGSPFVLFNFVAIGFLIGIQKSQQALFLLLISQSINIGLDFFLAVYLQWQLAGIAWATVISDVSGSVIALFFMSVFMKGKISSMFFLPEIIKKLSRIFSLNRDIFFRTIILISIFAFITAQSAKQGDVILAVNAILIQIFLFLANAIDGFANAAESKTGEAIGAYRKSNERNLNDEISLAYYASLFQSFLFLTLSFVFLFVFSNDILALLSNQEIILNKGTRYFYWLYILLLLSTTSFVVDGVFIGAAKGRSMLIAISTSTTLVFFPLWYLTLSLENDGLWLALCCFMLFRSGFSQWLYLQINKKQAWLIQE